MFVLFWHAGVFAVVTFVIYLACLGFIRIEDNRAARREQQQRGS